MTQVEQTCTGAGVGVGAMVGTELGIDDSDGPGDLVGASVGQSAFQENENFVSHMKNVQPF